MDRLGTMETFVRVVETGSFSAAARDLKIGQPAVSKSVAQLEERFGVRLLMRSTRGLTPTEAGQNFYERARKIIDEARDADTAVSSAAGGLSGRLRASAGVTIARLHIMLFGIVYGGLSLAPSLIFTKIDRPSHLASFTESTEPFRP